MIAPLVDNKTIPGVSVLQRKAKRCPKCGLIKPIEAFYKNRTRPDGRADWCIECKKAHRYAKGDVEVVVPGQKQCTGCKVIKSESEFYRCKNRRDGLQSRCKKCMLAATADRLRKRKAERDAAERIGYTIHTVDQIDSAVREMAETQLRIDAEVNICQQRVSRTIQESARVLEPMRRHLQHLKSAIESLFVRKDQKKATKQFRFGLVRYYRGNLEVELDVVCAKRFLGKL